MMPNGAQRRGAQRRGAQRRGERAAYNKVKPVPTMSNEDKQIVRSGVSTILATFTGTFCALMLSAYIAVAYVGTKVDRATERYRESQERRTYTPLTPLTQSK